MFERGIASSTASSYLTGWRSYINFCGQFQLQPLPLSEQTLCRFVAFLAQRSLSFQTVSVYLSACRFYHISAGLPDPDLPSFAHLTYVLRGLRRSGSGVRQIRLPITPEILSTIHAKWSNEHASFDRVMLWAAFCLGFFAFLRTGEFTCPSMGQFDESTMLAADDIAVDCRSNPSYLIIRLKRSKNDPFAQGVTLFVGKSYKSVCAVSAVLAYLAIRPSTRGPLFIFENGDVLSRQRLVLELRKVLQGIGIEASPYKGHSFRIGAATAAARAGISDSLIQSMGRWKSSAFMTYIRTPRDQLCRVANLLIP